MGRARGALRRAPRRVDRAPADADQPRGAARHAARVPRHRPGSRRRRVPRAGRARPAGPLDRHGLQRGRRAHAARGRRADPRDARRRPGHRRAGRAAARGRGAAARRAHALDGRLRGGREGRDGHSRRTARRDELQRPAGLRRQDHADARRCRDAAGGAARRPSLHARARPPSAGHADQQHHRCRVRLSPQGDAGAFNVEVAPPKIGNGTDCGEVARLVGIRRDLFTAVEGATRLEDFTRAQDATRCCGR